MTILDVFYGPTLLMQQPNHKGPPLSTEPYGRKFNPARGENFLHFYILQVFCSH
jgi:hypothetical protein